MTKFVFSGYVSAPGGEFLDRGALPDPGNEENCLYPVWYVEKVDSFYWISMNEKGNALKVFRAFWDGSSWDMDMDTNLFFFDDGTVEYPNWNECIAGVTPELSREYYEALVKVWPEVEKRCKYCTVL